MNNEGTYKRSPSGFFSLSLLLVGSIGASHEIIAQDLEPTALPGIKIEANAADDSYAPEMTSVAGKDSVSLLETPHSVTVFTRKRIDDQNLTTLGEVLQQVPGATVIPFDGANPDYRSRGYSMELTYDGVPSASGGSGTQEFDMAIYDRVEVLRGPSGLYQGSGQPGGTINFVRKRGLKDFAASGFVSAGSWENYRGEVDVGGALTESGKLRGRAVGMYQDRGFYYDKGNEQKWLGYFALDADITNNTTVSFAYTRQDDDFTSPSMGLPAFNYGHFIDVPRSTHVYPSWNSMWWDTEEFSAEIEQRFDNGWTIRAKGQQRTQDKFFKDAYPTPQVGVDPETFTTRYTRRQNTGSTERTAFDLYAAGPLVLFQRTHHLTLGYNAEERVYAGKSATFSVVEDVSIFDPDSVPEPFGDYQRGSTSEYEQSGFYGQARLSIVDPFTIILGGRLSNTESRNRNIAPSTPTPFTSRAEEDGHFTPYAAAVWKFQNNISLYGSFAEIFMPQSQLDADMKELEPREGEQYEIGVKARLFDGLNASVSYFEIQDINRALPTDVSNVFVAAGEVKVDGFEVELSGSPLANLQVSLGYTNQKTVYARHQSLQNAIFSLFEPRESLKLYARYEPAALHGFFLGAGVTASSAIVGTGEKDVREQGGFAIVNAQTGYRFDEDTTITLSINNLFDHKYYARVGNLNTYNTYGDPVNFSLGLRKKL